MNFFEDISQQNIFFCIFFLGIPVCFFACIYIMESKKDVIAFSYEGTTGPETWSTNYPDAAGFEQSPINLRISCCIIKHSKLGQALKFSEHFHEQPSAMKIYNNGYTVKLYAQWDDHNRPILYEGPLKEEYHLINICFRWGTNDVEGSEHLIHSDKFAMELQALFTKENSGAEDIPEAPTEDSLLMLSYVLKITRVENPFLEPIIMSLEHIKCPGECVCIEPIVLSRLMPSFSRGYFMYEGSLTFPPCTEGVVWIVKSEPLMISSQQVSKFRELFGNCGRINTNIRPVQKKKGREVFYYE